MRAAVILGLAAVLASGGCGRIERKWDEVRSPPPVPERPNDSCDSAVYREYVGQPSEVLNSLVFADPMRVIPDGSAYTQDYNPVRVNFDLDPEGNISRVWCG